MPIWLRKYIFNQLKEHYDSQNKKDDVESFTNKIKSGKVEVPDYAKGKNFSYNGGAS